MEFSDFPHPYMTVDVLIFSIINGVLVILLTKRNKPPFEGSWALPGGFIRMDESLDEAAKRITNEKGKMGEVYLEQLYSFGDIGRDPRGRVVSVSYFALVPEERTKQVEGWFPVDKLDKLSFDHLLMVKAGAARLKAKVTYSNIAVGLLPKNFRLSELQRVYEIILGRPLDKRNFRKKMTSLDLLIKVGETDKGEKRRPAMLYTFKETKQIFFK